MSLWYTNNQMHNRLDMDSILREEKSQWRENIECIIDCKSSIWNRQWGSVSNFIPDFFIGMPKRLQIYPGILGIPDQTHQK